MNIRRIIREEIDGVFSDIHGKKSSDIDYTAVVINDDDVIEFESKIFDVLSDMKISIPSDWNYPENYHMTIKMGPLGLGLQMAGAVGKEVELECYLIGISDDVIAIGVKGLFSKNEVQHITFAFKNNPKDSNNIINWKEIKSFNVSGIIMEVKKKDGFGKIKNK